MARDEMDDLIERLQKQASVDGGLRELIQWLVESFNAAGEDRIKLLLLRDQLVRRGSELPSAIMSNVQPPTGPLAKPHAEPIPQRTEPAKPQPGMIQGPGRLAPSQEQKAAEHPSQVGRATEQHPSTQPGRPASPPGMTSTKK